MKIHAWNVYQYLICMKLKSISRKEIQFTNRSGKGESHLSSTICFSHLSYCTLPRVSVCPPLILLLEADWSHAPCQVSVVCPRPPPCKDITITVQLAHCLVALWRFVSRHASESMLFIQQPPLNFDTFCSDLDCCSSQARWHCDVSFLDIHLTQCCSFNSHSILTPSALDQPPELEGQTACNKYVLYL